MFNSSAKIIKNQGEKIIELNKVLNKKERELFKKEAIIVHTTKMLDEAQEEFVHILDTIETILTTNSYGRDDIKISKAVAEIRYQKSIIEDDLDINKELVHDDQSRN